MQTNPFGFNSTFFYRNTIFYVLIGAFISVMLTVSAAFCATRKDLPGKNVIMFLILFTMYFAGGMIPMYMVVRGTGILNTPLAMILPNAVNTYNLTITMSYFRNLPDALEEAATIDGAGPIRVFAQILLPLATPIVAVISLYYAVAIAEIRCYVDITHLNKHKCNVHHLCSWHKVSLNVDCWK